MFNRVRMTFTIGGVSDAQAAAWWMVSPAAARGTERGPHRLARLDVDVKVV